MTNESTRLDTQTEDVEHILEQAEYTDTALLLIKHIDEPCVEPITGLNIRQFYIREAEKLLPKVENPFLKEALETRIAQYSLASN
jgi:hypothetical protein